MVRSVPLERSPSGRAERPTYSRALRQQPGYWLVYTWPTLHPSLRAYWPAVLPLVPTRCTSLILAHICDAGQVF
eukprot:scaffold11850_cov111-Isochrysis_galbana.AAC.2